MALIDEEIGFLSNNREYHETDQVIAAVVPVKTRYLL